LRSNFNWTTPTGKSNLCSDSDLAFCFLEKTAEREKVYMGNLRTMTVTTRVLAFATVKCVISCVVFNIWTLE